LRKHINMDANPYEYQFNMESTALLVIDMQNDFCAHGGFGEKLGNDIGEVIKIIPNIKSVINTCRSFNIQIIYTKEGHLPDLSDCPESKLRRSKAKGAGIGDLGSMGRIMIRGELGNDIVNELYPIEGDLIIHKPGKGSFYNTNLEEELETRGIKSLIVTGVTTHVCVHTTIREANDRGYECLLVEDCCAAYDRNDHIAAVNMTYEQGGIFGWVSSTENLIGSFIEGRHSNAL